jgi:hypothetical protein
LHSCWIGACSIARQRHHSFPYFLFLFYLSQENLSDYLIDNRDIEEQLETLRRSRASSPTYSSISSTAKSGSNGGGGSIKPFVIIAGGGSGDSGDLYDDSTRLQLAKATNFAELSRLRETLGYNSAINIVYMQQDRGDSGMKSNCRFICQSKGIF